MKTKINLLTSLMIIAFIVIGQFAATATRINVSGIGKISGNIRCTTSDLPLGNATVTLFSASDSSMVAGTISDNSGNFYFSMLGTGKYFIEISESGFEKQQISQLSILSGNPKISIGEVKLNPVCENQRKHKTKNRK